MPESKNISTFKNRFAQLDRTQVTGPERYRLFQSISVMFAAFGAATGSIYFHGIYGGVYGGLAGIVVGFFLTKYFLGDLKHIKRRNTLERTLDSAVSIVGGGIFAGTVGGFYGYYVAGDFQTSLMTAITCTIAGAVSTSLAGLAGLFWESLVQRRK